MRRRYVFIYLSSFFSLPVKRANGEYLTHEQVVNKLDNDTVQYDAGLGNSSRFTELLHVAIRVRTAEYEVAIAWLKDLLYGSVFDKERLDIFSLLPLLFTYRRRCRLQVTIAKTLQSIPELKRDGNTVLSSVSSEILYDDNSTSRWNGVLPQAEFVPTLSKQLQENPDEVIKAFEAIRTNST